MTKQVYRNRKALLTYMHARPSTLTLETYEKAKASVTGINLCYMYAQNPDQLLTLIMKYNFVERLS